MHSHINAKNRLVLSLVSIAILLLVGCQYSYAATYYVKNGGNDGADGLSDASAWATISKVNNRDLAAGDIVLFKRGSSWSDTLIPKTSGSLSLPITFDAYGSGDAPEINVNYDSSKKRSLYVSGKSHLHIKNMTLRNGTNEGEVHIGSVELSGSSYIVLEGLVVADTYSKCGLMVGSASSNVTVKDCVVYGTQFPRYMGVLVDGGGILVGDFHSRSVVGTTDGVSVINCEVYDNTGYGITIFEASNNRIAYNTIYNNWGPGIWGGGASGSHSSGNIVERNTIYENCQGQDDAYGIDFYRPGNNNVIRYNRVYSQFDTVNNGASRGIPFVPGLSNYIGTGGIRFDGNDTMPVLVTHGNIAHNNLVYNNYHGFEVIQISNTSVFNNTIYNNSSGGRAIGIATNNSITPKVSGTVVKNNLIYGQFFLMFDYNTENSDIDNNLYYVDSANLAAWGSYEAFFFYPSAGQTNQFSLWQATGRDQHSIISSNPQFVNASAGDLHINAGSPAVDMGTTEGIDIPSPWLDYDGILVPQGVAPDAGAYEQASEESVHIITASSGAGGSITPSGTVSAAAGSSIYFAITPEAGYYIADVVIDSISTGPIAGYLFSGITAGHTISVIFSNNWSRSYYVDASSGSNSNTGTSETKAWQTLSKVNEMKFNPGDTVKLKSGQTFSGPLYVYQSGTDGSHVVFDSYGGSALPVIDATGEAVGIRLLAQEDVFGSGADSLSYVTIRNLEVKNAGASNGESAGIWGAKLSNIVIDRMLVHSCKGVAGIFIDAPNEYVTISNSRVHTIISTTEARTAGIFGFGIVVSGTAGAGNSSHNTISDNTVYGNHNSGISVSNSSDNTISGNTVYLNGDCGIGLSEPGAHRNIIENNTVYENCQYKDDRSGINLFLVGNDNIVRYNRLHSQYDTYNDPQGHGILINTSEGTSTRLGSCGIRFDGGHEGFTSSTGNIVHTNLITGEGDGYQVYNFADTQFFNNTVYNSRRFGIIINGTHAASAVVKNNIISTMDSSATVGGYKHLAMVLHATGYDIGNNLYFPDGPTLFNLNETKTNFSGWQGANRDSSSLLGAPKFANIVSADFSLQDGSSAINLGTDEGITIPSPWVDLAGNTVPYPGTRPDAGAYESQAAPPVISGTIRASTSGNPPVQNVLVWLMDENFSPVGSFVLTDASGNFSIESEPIEGYLYIRPQTSSAEGYGIYSHQPRVYKKPLGSNTGIDIRLPAAATIIIRARDVAGSIMDKASFEAARGNDFSQFATLTNMNGEVVPHVVWEVDGADGRKYPALIADAGQSGGPFAVDVLFWQTSAYGKLLLTADNAGQGYDLPAAGGAAVIDLNQALLDTVNYRLQTKFGQTGATLDQALALRDDLELASARSSIGPIRKGTAEVVFKDRSGRIVRDITFSIRQKSHDFMFGAFQGAGSAGLMFEDDTARKEAYNKAREAGLSGITAVGLGWSYTEPYPNALIDARHGISSLKAMGYRVKIHGATWLWGSALPERIKSSTDWPYVISQNLDYRSSLLTSFDASGHIWEAMNEPAYNNYINMPRNSVINLLGQAASQTDRSTNIVNGPHEFDYGAKYLFFGLDNDPVNDYPLTYSEFLRDATLEGINTIGLQFYPGFRLSSGAEGPAMPPFWLADTVSRYSEMFPSKDIHITEFSVSSNGAGWTSGYWKEPWSQSVQADYADRIFTLMYANPSVKSVIWWDVLDDADTSVLNGGLLSAGGVPKTAYTTLKERITQDWTTNATLEANSQGQASVTGFGGTYEVTHIIPSYGPAMAIEEGDVIFHIAERSSSVVEIVLPVFTVIATAGANGTINPTGQIVTTEGSSASFVISPDGGYAVADVIVDGVSAGPLTSYTFNNIVSSHSIEAVFAMGVPASPSGLNATAVSTSEANLTWEDNSDNEEGFRVERSLSGSGSWTTVGTKAAGSVSHSDSGLSGHTRYYYRVYAFNGAGNSGYSNVASAETMNSDPILSPIGNKTTDEGKALIFTVSATDPDGDSVTYEAAPLPSGAVFNTNSGAFNWTPSYSQAGTYEVIFKARDGYGGYSQEAVTILVMNVLRTYTIEASAGTGGSISPSGAYTTQEGRSTRFTITADTGYSISNVYVDGVGQGGVGSYTFTNVQADHSIEAVFAMGVPASPSGLNATAVSTSEANLTWEDNSDNEEGFRVERSLSGSGSWTTVGTLPANTISYNNLGLTADTTYYYRVLAYNIHGDSGWSNTASVTTQHFTPTEEVHAPDIRPFSEVTSGSIAANWASGGNPDGTLYYCENITAGTGSGWTTGFKFVSTGLVPDRTYSFRVKAKNMSGAESGWVSLGSQKTSSAKTFSSVKNGEQKLLSGDVLGTKVLISLEIDGVSASEISEVNFYLNGDPLNSATTSRLLSRKTSVTSLTYELDLSPGEFSLRIEAIAVSGDIYEQVFSGLKVYSADVKTVSGPVLPYPNPYDPNAGPLRISYTLSSAADVALYIFDVTGRLVSKAEYSSSIPGGTAGYNEVTWNGRDLFGNMVENDIYLLRLIDRNSGKLLGKCRLMVLKR